MKKQEKSVNYLSQFLPDGAYDLVAPFFKSHVIHLSLTHERKSVLGDYRTPTKEHPEHRISINANLNPYSFLVTLLHELAHMFTFIQYGHKAAPHGPEWKEKYRHTLTPFLGKQIFPPDVERALHAYLQDPAASTCADPRLFKALYRYDERETGQKLVDQLPQNALFVYDGQTYQIIERRRTRIKCKNIQNGKMYLFPGIAEVKEVKE